jgi:predicted enzyme related to lactoylglutathione lyase
MTVLRVVTNIDTSSIEEVQRFYETLFDMVVVMNHGWLVTLDSGETAATQLNIAKAGGSGTPVPDISIEVSDVDEVYRRVKTLGLDIVYELTDEPWGVRRFYLRDPTGKLLNVMAHRQN